MTDGEAFSVTKTSTFAPIISRAAMVELVSIPEKAATRAVALLDTMERIVKYLQMTVPERLVFTEAPALNRRTATPSFVSVHQDMEGLFARLLFPFPQLQVALGIPVIMEGAVRM